jgi:hypothetical protein
MTIDLPAALLGLARNPRVEVELLRRLAGSGDEEVLVALCRREDLTEALALALAEDERLRVCLAQNFPVAVRIWRRLAADPDPAVRAALAGGRGGTIVDPGHEIGREPDPPLPDEVGRAMFADTHPTVRLAMATGTGTPGNCSGCSPPIRRLRAAGRSPCGGKARRRPWSATG